MVAVQLWQIADHVEMLYYLKSFCGICGGNHVRFVNSDARLIARGWDVNNVLEPIGVDLRVSVSLIMFTKWIETSLEKK